MSSQPMIIRARAMGEASLASLLRADHLVASNSAVVVALAGPLVNTMLEDSEAEAAKTSTTSISQIHMCRWTDVLSRAMVVVVPRTVAKSPTHTRSRRCSLAGSTSISQVRN